MFPSYLSLNAPYCNYPSYDSEVCFGTHLYCKVVVDSPVVDLNLNLLELITF